MRGNLVLTTGIAVTILSVAVCCPVVLAQSATTAIAGVGADPNGATVPGPRVVAKNTATNARTLQITGEDGFYRLANLVPGEYVVEIVAEGFRRASLSPRQLSAVSALRVDVTLEIGQVTEFFFDDAATTEIYTED